MRLQSIADIAEICFRKGISKAILSPGSRCAPLTLAFARHPHIDTFTISDERSAAFIGLGMADHLRKPVVLVCTSGSAAYNYAPAIAEAFYRSIPLLVLTADRPPEWIDQWDGQTIRQEGIYGKHVLKSFQLPVSLEHADSVWHSGRVVSEAINLCNGANKGPVHINIPLREPFYPESDETYGYSDKINAISEIYPDVPSLDRTQIESFKALWQQYEKKLVIAGQSELDPKLNEKLHTEIISQQCVIVGDSIANLTYSNRIKYHDTFLGKADLQLKEALKPDLLITFGRSVISKNLKLFLRSHKPKAHWHIAASGEIGDPFQSLSHIIRTTPTHFFESIFNAPVKDQFREQKEANYQKLWQIEDEKVKDFHETFFRSAAFGEFGAINTILKKLPDHSDLHVANSMTVRYVSLLAALPHGVRVFANRGTSGIDGSNSTAVGTALTSGKLTTLITGDMAFFYDRNAFWHNYPLNNLRIIVLNNHGGGIFRLIKGPSEQPELDEYFETRQRLDAKNTAADFGFTYASASNKAELETALEGFFDEDASPKLLEVFSDSKTNQEIFSKYKLHINNNYGQ